MANLRLNLYIEQLVFFLLLRLFLEAHISNIIIDKLHATFVIHIHICPSSMYGKNVMCAVLKIWVCVCCDQVHVYTHQAIITLPLLRY